MRRININKRERRVVVLPYVAAVLAGLMLAGCASAQPVGKPSGPVPGLPVPAPATHRLTAMADRAARAHGGAAPAWASAVVTTHEKALTSATPGDIVYVGEKAIVYLVTMKGHFIAGAVSVPLGGHAPTGSYMSIVVDARTFKTLDVGLSSKSPPVAPASFGPVTYLNVGTLTRHLRRSLVPGQRGAANAVWSSDPRSRRSGHIVQDPLARHTGSPAYSTADPELLGIVWAGRYGWAFSVWSVKAESRRTHRFRARGSAAHRGSAGWHLPHRRRPASRTPVRSLRRASSCLPPP